MRGNNNTNISNDGIEDDRTPIKKISDFPIVRVCSPGGRINDINYLNNINSINKNNNPNRLSN